MTSAKTDGANVKAGDRAASNLVTSSKPQTISRETASRAKKLADKFATFTSGRMKKQGGDRQLIVEPAHCNWNAGRKEDKAEARPPKQPSDAAKPKKKKRAAMNITEGMSRADIFAVSLANAVDAAEATDDDEDFIYRGHSRTPSLTSLNGQNQAQAQPQTTFAQPHMPQDNYGYPYHNNVSAAVTPHQPRGVGNFATYSPGNRPALHGYYNGSTSDSDNDEGPSGRYGTGKKHGSPDTRSPNAFQRHGRGIRSFPDMTAYPKNMSNYGSAGYFDEQVYRDFYGGGDGERLPLFAKWRPPYEEHRRRVSRTLSKFSCVTIVVFFFLVFSSLLYFVSTRPLSEVSIIDVTNVLTADTELMFNIHVKARNYDIWDIEIVDADLNVFAARVTGGVRSGNHRHDNQNATIAASFNSSITGVQAGTNNEYLGRIFSFDEKLVFGAGVSRNGVVSIASSQVRLKNPGGRADNSAQDKWTELVRSGFNLIVRGVLKYTLPFSQDQSVRVCFIRHVDGSIDGGDNGASSPTWLVASICSEDWGDDEM